MIFGDILQLTGGGVYAIIVNNLTIERFLSDEYEVKFRCDGNWCNYKR